MARVTVVGLGPGGADLLTAGTSAAIAAIPVRFLRTARHPAAVAVPGARALDHLYDKAQSFEEVYAAIVDALVEAAEAEGHVLYAVPGSPAVAERTVELLRSDGRVEVEVLPAMSCVDLAWARLGVDPASVGVRIVDGRRFAVEAAAERGPLLVLQCDQLHVLSEIKLSVEVGPATPVTVLSRLGLPDEAIFDVPWDELDRSVIPDHLTSLWIPAMATPVGWELARFVELVHALRQRCPWDREQTHQTLTRHLLEETYEVLEAIEGLGRGPDGGWRHLAEELGDLLFQVVFHATLAAEEGQFNLADVAAGIHDKLVRRHPHVFAGVAVETAEAVVTNWEQMKRAEKGRASIMDGIPGALPSLLYAHQVQGKAASIGFDWEDATGAYPKVTEELAELQAAAAAGDAHAQTDEMGDLLFACVNVARHLGIDSETALRAATAKFRDRFAAVEALADARGVDLVTADLGALDDLWEEVKAGTPSPLPPTQ